MTYDEIRHRADQVRRVPLETVLETIGAHRDPHDKAKWHTPQGVLSVTGTKFMNWNRDAGGGGAIDLVIHLQQTDFKTALSWLCHHFPHFHGPLGPDPSAKPTLRLPHRDDRKLARVTHYLVRQRAIPSALVDTLTQSGVLYADPRANAVFLLRGKQGQPVGAELRGTTHIPWHSMAPGTRKDHGYFAVRPPDQVSAPPVILCESAIDALSCHILHPHSLCISTSGVTSRPRWLTRLISQGYRVCCGYDSDAAGERMARALISHHPTVRRLRPREHDWNDILRKRSNSGLPPQVL